MKRREVVFISSRLHNVSWQRTSSLVVVYDTQPHEHIASSHARPGRGDDRTARDADAPTSRRKPLCGFARHLGANAQFATPLSASHSIRVSIFHQSAHIVTDRDADRARDALKIRGAAKKEARAVARRTRVTSLNPSHVSAKP